MIFDIHIHTFDHSPDARVPASEIIRMAKAAALDGIVLTEHDYIWFPHELETLRRVTGGGLRVFSGAEICFPDMHLLVYGCPSGPVPVFTGPRDSIAWVRQQGGAVVVAHPFGPDTVVDRVTLSGLGVDGVEVFNGRRKQMNSDACGWMGAMELAVTGGTDFHGRNDDRIGRCATVFPETISSIGDIVRAIRDRRTAPIAPVT
ncbi:PHP domain-containing protein [bacterium]|nr:PHP domain-containing protein [candidate division CSSED10-310 bacterium]